MPVDVMVHVDVNIADTVLRAYNNILINLIVFVS